MFRPVRMCKLNVLVLEKHVAALTRALGDQGLVHLVDAAAQSGQHLLAGVDRGAALDAIEPLEERCTALIDALGVSPETAVAAQTYDRAQVTALLDDVQARQQHLDQRLRELQREADRLTRESARRRRYPLQDVHLDALRPLSFLYVTTGQMAPALIADAAAALGEQVVVLHDDQDPARPGLVLVLAAAHKRGTVDSELAKRGFVKEDLPEPPAAGATEELPTLDRRLAATHGELETARQERAALPSACGGHLLAARQQLRGTLAVLRAQQRFGHSALLTCVSGWVPRAREGAVRALVAAVTGGTGLVERVEPEADERVHDGLEAVPVQFAPSRWLLPFRSLISNFGVPRYDEIDPSLFVALSFILMFGLMFGDVGQGLAIAVLGLWLRQTRRPALAAFRPGGTLLLLCGLSAATFGFCYGSVFGYENARVLKPLWMNPLRDVTRVLTAAIVVGVVCISVAVVINILNRLHNRRWFESVFDKFGVLGILFYWGALGLGLKAAKAGELRAGQFVLLVILPLALLFVREPLHQLLQRRRALPEGPLIFILEACIETMETVTAFLGSTVSFVRIGAFALSHAALCLAIYSVVEILQKLPGGGLWSVLVLVFGNLLVILMEGMVALIQGVRLQYYELFSKYFPGDGTLYVPFTLAEQPLAQEKET